MELCRTLRQSTGNDAVAVLERMVRDAPDHALTKINALDLAAKEGLDDIYRTDTLAINQRLNAAWPNARHL